MVDVEGGTWYSSDWGALLVAKAKVRDQLEVNIIDFGAFRLIFLISISSNENNLLQDRSILLKLLRPCFILGLVVQ